MIFCLNSGCNNISSLRYGLLRTTWTYMRTCVLAKNIPSRKRAPTAGLACNSERVRGICLQISCGNWKNSAYDLSYDLHAWLSVRQTYHNRSLWCRLGRRCKPSDSTAYHRPILQNSAKPWRAQNKSCKAVASRGLPIPELQLRRCFPCWLQRQ